MIYTFSNNISVIFVIFGKTARRELEKHDLIFNIVGTSLLPNVVWLGPYLLLSSYCNQFLTCINDCGQIITNFYSTIFVFWSGFVGYYFNCFLFEEFIKHLACYDVSIFANYCITVVVFNANGMVSISLWSMDIKITVITSMLTHVTSTLDSNLIFKCAPLSLWIYELSTNTHSEYDLWVV